MKIYKTFLVLFLLHFGCAAVQPSERQASSDLEATSGMPWKDIEQDEGKPDAYEYPSEEFILIPGEYEDIIAGAGREGQYADDEIKNYNHSYDYPSLLYVQNENSSPDSDETIREQNSDLEKPKIFWIFRSTVASPHSKDQSTTEIASTPETTSLQQTTNAPMNIQASILPLIAFLFILLFVCLVAVCLGIFIKSKVVCCSKRGKIDKMSLLDGDHSYLI